MFLVPALWSCQDRPWLELVAALAGLDYYKPTCIGIEAAVGTVLPQLEGSLRSWAGPTA